MNIYILTLFPDMLNAFFKESIISRAQDKGIVNIKTFNLREWGIGDRRNVDDVPFGGGPGMVFRVDVVDKALTSIGENLKGNTAIILTSASGKKYTQKEAMTLKEYENMIIICGHYEGVDERIREHLCTHSYSIGDYVLTGGEIPAATITDSVVRLLPGTLGNRESLVEESNEDLLEYPQYTRPREYKGWEVPEVLVSGNHKEIEEWRKEKSEDTTKLHK